MNRRRLILPLAALLLCLQSVSAQENPNAERLAARLEMLQNALEQLKEVNNAEATERTEQQIAELRAALAKVREQAGQVRRERREQPNREALVGRVMSAVEALEALGRTEDARRLGAVLRELQGQRESRQTENREREGQSEARAGRSQARAIRIAVEALNASGRKDGARQLELAARSIEMAIEGRRDEEAQEIREAAPSRGNRAEWMMLASRILREKGQREAATVVERIAQQFAGQARAVRDREQGRERESAPRRERPTRERQAENREREEHPEIRAARRQANAIRMAMQALLDSDREDGARQLELAARSIELAIEGRHDEEAQEIREAAPSRGNRAEWMMLASRMLKEKGKNEAATEVENIAKQFADQARAIRAREQGREREFNSRRERPARESNEREVAIKQLKTMREALPALREAGRKDTAEILMKAIRAREVILERARGEEADAIRENAPKLGAQIEILRFAARLWRDEFKNAEKAEALERLANQLAGRDRQSRKSAESAEAQQQELIARKTAEARAIQARSEAEARKLAERERAEVAKHEAERRRKAIEAARERAEAATARAQTGVRKRQAAERERAEMAEKAALQQRKKAENARKRAETEMEEKERAHQNTMRETVEKLEQLERQLIELREQLELLKRRRR